MSERTDLVIATLSGVDLLLRSELEDDLAGQGAVLALALTLWLMRHPVAERPALYDRHLRDVRRLWAQRERKEE